MPPNILERNPLVPRIEETLVRWEANGELRARFLSLLTGAALALGLWAILGAVRL